MSKENSWENFLGYTICIVMSLVGWQIGEAQQLTAEEVQLFNALKTTVTLENGMPVYHCRQGATRDPRRAMYERCDTRVMHYTRYIVRSSEEAGLDPWLIASIAVVESALNPFAVSSIGAAGIMQLNPRYVGRESDFVMSPALRRRCRTIPGECQREVVSLGVNHLTRWIDRCGSVRRALGGYSSGTCGVNSYARRVLSVRSRLLSSPGCADGSCTPPPFTIPNDDLQNDTLTPYELVPLCRMKETR